MAPKCSKPNLTLWHGSGPKSAQFILTTSPSKDQCLRELTWSCHLFQCTLGASCDTDHMARCSCIFFPTKPMYFKHWHHVIFIDFSTQSYINWVLVSKVWPSSNFVFGAPRHLAIVLTVESASLLLSRECGESRSYASSTFYVPRSVCHLMKSSTRAWSKRAEISQILAWTGSGAACSGSKQCWRLAE